MAMVTVKAEGKWTCVAGREERPTTNASSGSRSTKTRPAVLPVEAATYLCASMWAAFSMIDAAPATTGAPGG